MPQSQSRVKGRVKKAKRSTVVVVDEPPLVFNIDGRVYECRSVINTVNGLLCVQYDGTVTPLPQPTQQHQTHHSHQPVLV